MSPAQSDSALRTPSVATLHDSSTWPGTDDAKVLESNATDRKVEDLIAEESDSATVEPLWVDWEGSDDPENPRNWNKSQKWALSLVGIFFCVLVSLSVGGYSVGQESIQTDIHTSRIGVLLGLTMFILTFGFAPLILAPLSEVFGRSWIYLGSAWVFCLFFIPQALATNLPTMLISRFISGIAGSTAVSLVGGSISDVWADHERGLPMALFSFAAFAATGLGPVIFGPVEYHYDFRYITWILFGVSGAFAATLPFVLKETRASVILSRKARALRESTGDLRYQAKGDSEKASLVTLLETSLTRPVRMLFTEPVLFSFSLWIGVVWAVLYLELESVNLVFGGIYGFNLEQSSAVFTTQVVGAGFGLAIDLYCDTHYKKQVSRRGPEARLYSAMVGGCCLPIGAFLYTFTAYKCIHWILPAMGLTILYTGMQLVYLSCFNYLADSYNFYASSALSAQSSLRNLFGSVAPLFTSQMYSALGIQGAGGLTAGVLLLLSPTPFLLFKYGERLRHRSKFATLLEEGKGPGEDVA